VVIFAGSEDKAKRMIRISDDGSGMTARQLETNWVRIGFSDKLESKKGRFGRRADFG
jgi:HSP90 family molecular chaperone